MSQASLANLAKGRRFGAGQSGNPGGRPLAEKEVAAALRLHGQELVDALIKVALEGNVAAIREAFDRSIGKAKERIELTGVDGGPISVTTDALRSLPVEKLEMMREILASAKVAELGDGNPEPR
jgi:hypothetical protein